MTDEGLTRAVHTALTDQTRGTPAAALALLYAARLDEATHVPLAMQRALQTMRAACEACDDRGAALDALAKVAAALSSVTVAAELGPKLLATLDALLLTPKARTALQRKLGDELEPANPLDALRGEQDELKARRDRRSAS